MPERMVTVALAYDNAEEQTCVLAVCDSDDTIAQLLRDEYGATPQQLHDLEYGLTVHLKHVGWDVWLDEARLIEPG